MKIFILICSWLISSCAIAAPVEPPDDPIGIATAQYFDTLFARLKAVVDRQPTKETFRKAMKPLADETPGFFGGTYIDTNFVIREVYNPRDFLARGYDLKKVPQLDYFWELMRSNPSPQLSEPGHGHIMQPRLIALRYPMLKDGRLVAVVSVMVRTPAYLEAVGLDKVSGYRITCRGVLAEEYGELSSHPRAVKVSLPANEWLIEYEP
jgi:hypothetical protein